MDCWELVETVIPVSNRVLLYGSPGTGKSWAGARLGNPQKLFTFSVTEDTSAAELRGHYGLVDGNYKWLDGPCISAWRHGARLVLNEIDKSCGDAQTFLLGILDDMEIAGMTLPSGEFVKPAKGFSVVATMNGHPETDLLDSLKDRFPVSILINKVNPEAVKLLPQDLQNYADKVLNESIPSIRKWNAYASLRTKVDKMVAAHCVFGQRAHEILSAMES